MPAGAVQSTRRRGQRGTPRRSGRPQPPPGAAQQDPRQDPDFLMWNAQIGGGVGTVPEWMVFRWLERRMGFRHEMEFVYVPVVGGLRQREGLQVDFVVLDYLAWQVNGIYWHYRTVDQREKNAMDRAIVESRGYIYCELLDMDIIEQQETTLRLAMQGLEMPNARQGIQS